MVNIEDAVIAKLKKNNQNFEILVDCEPALKFRKGEETDIRSILAVDNVFKDAKKGDVAPNIEDAFGTTNIEDIAKEIITKGEIQLTAEYKKKLSVAKKQKLVGMISQNAMDPKTRLPIPPTRIENAMEQARIHIDPFKSAEEQMDAVVNALRPILAISFEHRKFTVIIPAQFASQTYGLLKKYGKMSNEQWLSNGSLQANVEMPAGISEEFIDKLNKATHGDVQIDEIK